MKQRAAKQKDDLTGNVIQANKAAIENLRSLLDVEASVEVVTATEVRYGREIGDFSKLKTLFDRYGMDAMPALFINGELTLYGGVPSAEKLSEVIGKAANPTKKSI